MMGLNRRDSGLYMIDKQEALKCSRAIWVKDAAWRVLACTSNSVIDMTDSSHRPFYSLTADCNLR